MAIETEFDFEYWAELAKSNPDEFERLRKEHIDKIIHNSPEDIQNRMQGIQWQIDQIRLTSKTPMAACIKISSMMWDSVLGDNGLVEAIEKLQPADSPQQGRSKKTANSADVIQFPNHLEQENDQNP